MTERRSPRVEVTFYHLVAAVARTALELGNLDVAVELIHHSSDLQSPAVHCQYLDLFVDTHYKTLVDIAEDYTRDRANSFNPSHADTEQEFLLLWREAREVVGNWLVSAPLWNMLHATPPRPDPSPLWWLGNADMRPLFYDVLFSHNSWYAYWHYQYVAPRQRRHAGVTAAIRQARVYLESVEAGRMGCGDRPDSVDHELQAVSLFKVHTVVQILEGVCRLEERDMAVPADTQALANRAAALALPNPAEPSIRQAHRDAMLGEKMVVQAVLDWWEEQGNAFGLLRQFLSRVSVAPLATPPLD
jgi:hypothetical protein